MRLICPNCDAQYEVDDSVIPENGRDVQCSNCGNTWFQNAAGWEDEAAAQAVATDENVAPPEPEPEPEFDEPVVSEAADTSEPDSSELDQPDQSDEITENAVRTEHAPRELGESVSSILREEADREAAQRASENVGLETQTDLGLNEPSGDQTSEVKDRMARLRGLDDDLGASAAATAVAGSARKDLLPDIEEINSTLTASTGTAEDGSEQNLKEATEKLGFRRGFAITILIFAIFALIYLFSQKIAQAVPSAEPALTSYVDWVNALRAAIDNLMQSAVSRLTALVSQISGSRAS